MDFGSRRRFWSTLGAFAVPMATACELVAPIGPAPAGGAADGSGSISAAAGREGLVDAAGATTGGRDDGLNRVAGSAGVVANGMAAGGNVSRGELSVGGTQQAASAGAQPAGGVAGEPSPHPFSSGGSGGTYSDAGEGGESGAMSSGGTGALSSDGGTAGAGASGGAPAPGVGGTAGAGATGAGGGMAGTAGGPEPSTRPSCEDATTTCGTSGEDCCASELVPSGTFSFGIGAQEQPSVATVSSFYLDKYEVTTARLAAFLAHYDAWRAAGNPAIGANALATVPGSGWQSDWEAALPRDAATFEANMMGCDNTPTLELGEPSSLPANCLSWEEAFAFCLWDKARLPTSAEWEYATIGGDEYRPQPWGSEPITHARAIYNCLGDGIDGCSLSDIVPVGSTPLGVGRWGQYDLVGSMREWMFDYAGDYPTTCDDCALGQGEFRTFRGGCWYDSAGYLLVSRRDYYDPPLRDESEGVRCARSFE